MNPQAKHPSATLSSPSVDVVRLYSSPDEKTGDTALRNDCTASLQRLILPLLSNFPPIPIIPSSPSATPKIQSASKVCPWLHLLPASLPWPVLHPLRREGKAESVLLPFLDAVSLPWPVPPFVIHRPVSSPASSSHWLPTTRAHHPISTRRRSVHDSHSPFNMPEDPSIARSSLRGAVKSWTARPPVQPGIQSGYQRTLKPCPDRFIGPAVLPGCFTTAFLFLDSMVLPSSFFFRTLPLCSKILRITSLLSPQFGSSTSWNICLPPPSSLAMHDGCSWLLEPVQGRVTHISLSIDGGSFPARKNASTIIFLLSQQGHVGKTFGFFLSKPRQFGSVYIEAGIFLLQRSTEHAWEKIGEAGVQHEHLTSHYLTPYALSACKRASPNRRHFITNTTPKRSL